MKAPVTTTSRIRLTPLTRHATLLVRTRSSQLRSDTRVVLPFTASCYILVSLNPSHHAGRRTELGLGVVVDMSCYICLAGLHGARVAITGRRADVMAAAVEALKKDGIEAVGLQVGAVHAVRQTCT